MLKGNVNTMVDFYNNERIRFFEHKQKGSKASSKDFVNYDSSRIIWSDIFLNDIEKNIAYHFDDSSICEGLYRPFFKQYLCYDKQFIQRTYQQLKLFPTAAHENIVICVSGIGASKDFSTIITNTIPNYHTLDTDQCFPLYWYDDSTSDIADLFNQDADKPVMDKYERKDGISDYILNTARKLYGFKVAKEDIFYYVYGFLHSPEYRAGFASDLKKSLPRIPLVENPEDFWSFSSSGRSLAKLHLDYEHVDPYSKITIIGDKKDCIVSKMRFGKNDDKSVDRTTIVFNDHITIKDIPQEAYGYTVNGKSAIECIMERYQISVDEKSGIINDPNKWSEEHGDKEYILNLLLRIITVSVETMKIVHSLPKVKFE